MKARPVSSVVHPFVVSRLAVQGKEEALRPFAPPLASDAAFQRQVARVREAMSVFTAPGTDLRDHLSEPVTHPTLLAWLDASERTLAAIKGRKDLVQKRRHFILRTDDAMPFDYPKDVALQPGRPGQEVRLFRLRDEAEWLPIAFERIQHPATDVRPVRAIFRHAHVRAILDWRASHLDMWLSAYPHLLGGYIVHEFSDEARAILDARLADRPPRRPRSHVNEVKFDAWRFWLWYVAQTN